MIKTKQDIELEIVPVREMTKEEVETVARILFNAWKREFEKDPEGWLKKVGDEEHVSPNVHYDKKNDCIIGKFTRTLDENTIKQSADEIKKLSEEHHCNHLLIDLREMKVNSVLDYYKISKTLSDLGIAKEWKRAVLVPRRPGEPDVFETESAGKGNTIKVCFDPEAALKWLEGN